MGSVIHTHEPNKMGKNHFEYQSNLYELKAIFLSLLWILNSSYHTSCFETLTFTKNQVVVAFNSGWEIHRYLDDKEKNAIDTGKIK